MRFRLFVLLLLVFLMPLVASPSRAVADISGNGVFLVRVADVITPPIADFVTDAVDAANSDGAAAVLLEIDTPGGLDTAMRSIVQALLGSRIPVIVYVAPPGARAASAGALITLAADFAVMAPGTNIGAAHPVSIGPGSDKDPVMAAKIENDAVAYARSLAQQRGRNVEWAERMVRQSISTPAVEAQQLQIIDLVAADRTELLRQLEGRSYLRDGQRLILHSAGQPIRELKMSWRQRILAAVSQPTVAYLLLLLGIVGIFYEVSQPGVILPGAVGTLALLLALIGLQALPVNYVGVLLILLALILFILEIKITSYGMLTVGGIVALAAGSLVLIDSPLPFLQVSRAVIVATVVVTGGFCALVLRAVARSQQRRPVAGAEGMVGHRGEALSDIADDGRVMVDGELWQARSVEPISRGSMVEIVQVEDGLRLLVRQFKE